MVKIKTKLYGYQKKAVRKALKKKGFALFMEPGTGKTLVSLYLLAKRLKKIKFVLVICPKIAIEDVWIPEIEKHCTFKYNLLSLETLQEHSGSLKRYISQCNHVNFLLINFERSWRVEKLLRRIPWAMGIIDESHRIKGPTSKQSKAIGRIGRQVKYRLALTGTPVGNTDIDLWAQFRFISPNIHGDNWKRFRKKWTKKCGFEKRKVELRQHKVLPFLRALRNYSFYITKDEALDLPDRVSIKRTGELRGESKRIYNDLKTKFLAKIGDDLLITPFKVTQMMKLHQITGGFVRLEDGTDVFLEPLKLNLLLEVIRDLPSNRPIVIYCNFIAEIKLIQEKLESLRYDVGVIRGGIKDTHEILTDFREGLLDFLIIQIKSGVGIDLSKACIAIFYSLTFSYIDYKQARSRLHRKGQVNKVTYIHLLKRKTIDIYIYNALKRKSSIAKYVLNQLKGEQSVKKQVKKRKT